jgi:hypothetical protein
MKFKRPFNFVVSSLRALGADTHAHAPLIEYLMRMGQGLFQHPTPTAIPTKQSPGSAGCSGDGNFAFALASNEVPSADVSLDLLAHAVAGDGRSPRRRGSSPISSAARGLQPRSRLFKSMFRVRDWLTVPTVPS